MLEEHLHPKGVGVVIEAEHLYMTLRGAPTTGAKTLTAARRGLLRTAGRSRHELVSLAHAGGSV